MGRSVGKAELMYIGDLLLFPVNVLGVLAVDARSLLAAPTKWMNLLSGAGHISGDVMPLSGAARKPIFVLKSSSVLHVVCFAFCSWNIGRTDRDKTEVVIVHLWLHELTIPTKQNTKFRFCQPPRPLPCYLMSMH